MTVPLPLLSFQRPPTTLKKRTGWSLSQTEVRRPSLAVSLTRVPTEFQM
jgi:hypothetical protein